MYARARQLRRSTATAWTASARVVLLSLPASLCGCRTWRSLAHRRRTRFVLAVAGSRLAAFVPIAALLCSRVARLLQKLCPSVSLLWTIRRSFSRCWISGHLVHNHGFALVRQFLAILSCPSSLVADRATVRFRGIYPSAAYGRSWPRLCQNARRFGSVKNSACQNALYRPRSTSGRVERPSETW
jgi:hypothetical protein